MASSDAEIARKMQQDEYVGYGAPPPGYAPEGHYAAASQDPQTSSPLGMEPEPRAAVVMLEPGPTAGIMNVLRRRSLVKFLAVLDVVFALLYLLLGADLNLMQLAGLIFAPIGWIGAHRLVKWAIIVYFVYNIVDLFLLILTIIIMETEPFVFVLMILSIIIQVFICGYIGSFVKLLGNRQLIQQTKEYLDPRASSRGRVVVMA